MRRRTFFIASTMDLLLSSTAGLPAIIHEDDCDSRPPSNLFDTDFDEDCESLPSSRPPSNPTPMLYYCYKGRLAKIFRRVSRQALSCKATSHKEIMKLDAELHQTHADIPPSLRMRPLSSSFIGEAYVVLHRLNSNMFYLLSLCILHRGFLSCEGSDQRFDYSRKTCFDAALQMLEYQVELHYACQPGGRFENAKWMLSSLTLQYFLLAAMITSLDLYESQKSTSPSPESLEAQAKKYNVLKMSLHIWTSRAAFSRDARRASRVLAIMLSKVPKSNVSSNLENTAKDVPTMPQNSANGEYTIEAELASSSSLSGHLDGFDFSAPEFPVEDYAPSDFNLADPLDTIFNEPNDIDWVSTRNSLYFEPSQLTFTKGLFDEHILGRSSTNDVPLDWQLPEGLETLPRI